MQTQRPNGRCGVPPDRYQDPGAPPAADLLSRRRLVDLIHAYLDRKLILISAAAGYGKTTLLIDFAHDTELPVCWYSLDPFDADLHIFLEHLIAAIAQRFPSLWRAVAHLSAAGGRSRPQPLPAGGDPGAGDL